MTRRRFVLASLAAGVLLASVSAAPAAAGDEPLSVAELAGTWRLVGVRDSDTGEYFAFDGGLAEATVAEIDANGRMSATGGCNTIMTRLSRDGGTWRIGPPATTRMACPDPGMADAERSIIEALDHAADLAFDGDTVTFVDGGGAPLLVMLREYRG
jgi:putative lipoprotein